MNKIALSLDEVKKIQIELLDYLDEVCKDNNIDYWLDSGTLIGSIRHKGYIPWDDDIDVCVKRSDYDKLLHCLEDNKGQYKIFSMYNNPDYFYLFAKLADTTTLVEEKGIRKIPGLGVNIDIFPMDYLPQDRKKRIKIENKVFFLRALVCYGIYTKHQFKNASIKYKLIHIVGKIFGWRRALIKADKCCKKTSKENSAYIIQLVAATRKGIEVKKSCFDESNWGVFEGKEYPIPKGYHDYLTAAYGNYMELPPIEKRVLKHDFKAYRFE